MRKTRKKPHIIFVYPPGKAAVGEKERRRFKMCLGSAYITAYLRRQGFTARQFLAHEPINVRRCAAQIAAREPWIAGFTVYHSNYLLCQSIARALKAADPRIIIVFGGPTAAVQAGEILENNSFVDLCVPNEGEETCLQLLSQLEKAGFDLNETSLEEVPGIVFRREGAICESKFPGRPKGRNLDRYPSPYLSGVVESSPIGIITARGCSQHCTYCNCAVLSKREIAVHSVDRVAAELDYIYRQMENKEPVDIFDDTFTLLPHRAMEICRRIIENKIKLSLNCSTRCDCIDEELLEKMKEAGFKMVGFSLESAVPRLLRIIGKVQPPFTRSDPGFEKESAFIEKFKKSILYAKKIGIETVYASIMVGLPGETAAEGRRTVDFLKSLGPNIDFYAHNIFHVYPGTPIFSNFEKYGLKVLKYSNNIFYKTVHPYDIAQVRPAANAVSLKESAARDKTNMKHLALTVSLQGRDISTQVEVEKTKQKFFGGIFHRLILCAHVITRELVEWLREYFIMNGLIIQIYPGLDEARRFHEDNKRALIEYESPGRCHSEYYRFSSGARQSATWVGVTLIPYRTHILGQSHGLKINLLDTRRLFAAAQGSGIDPTRTVCIDREKEDTLALHRVLEELSRLKSRGGSLFDLPVYPYFAGLCRWQAGAANCALLETLIVDEKGNVKTCWQGYPVGRVGQPLPDIAANIRGMRSRVEKERGCAGCPREEECARCIFPGFLSGSEYCEMRKAFDTGESVQLLRALDIFKV